MERIGIFCSASSSIDPYHFEITRSLGEWIGKKGKTIMYGGANLGLMECMAIAVKENGGKVIGVVPEILEENGKVSRMCDETIQSHNLSDRKDIIVEGSDILVALPGGIGTLDEIFHVMGATTIGYHTKKVVFLNVNGFYDELLAFLDKLREGGFCRRPFCDHFEVANTLDELKELLDK